MVLPSTCNNTCMYLHCRMFQSSHASLFTNTYPEQCGLGVFTLCNVRKCKVNVKL